MSRKIILIVASLLTLVIATATSNFGKLHARVATATDVNPSLRDGDGEGKSKADFKVGKVFYYFINKEKGLVGVAPCTKGINDMYQYDIVIPPTVTYAEEGGESKEYKVIAIGMSAFANCFNLGSVTMPEGIEYIGRTAFWGTNLKEIIVPNSVVEIGDRCFKDNIKLEHLRIGKGLKKVGVDILSGCWNLKNLEVEPENAVLSSEGGLLYNKDKTTLIKCPSYRKDVKKVTLPATVTKVGAGAFEYCKYLTEIDLNDGLKEIGPRAFYLCSSLESLRIPASVEKIDDGSAFILMAGCKKFEVDPASDHYSTLLDGRLLLQNETKTMVSLLYTTDTATITIPDEVEHIAEGAMMVIYEGGTEEIYRGRGTQQVILPKGLKSIGAYAFSGTNIGSMKVPDGVEVIPNGMLSDCKKLSYVSFGKGCKQIGSDVFNDCDVLANTRRGVLRCYAEEPPVMLQINPTESAEFDEDMTKRTILQVPQASVAKYMRADGWKNFLVVRKLEEQANEEIAKASLSIIPSQGSLTIKTTEASPLYIYALDGTILFSTSDTQAIVSLPQGVYLVSYQGKAYKTYVY